MIFLNIVGVLVLYAVWKLEKQAVGNTRDMDHVSGCLIPTLIAACICWVFFDLAFKILG